MKGSNVVWQISGRDGLQQKIYKETSAMIMGEGRQYGRTLCNCIFNKTAEVFGYIPILVDCGSDCVLRAHV